MTELENFSNVEQLLNMTEELQTENEQLREQLNSSQRQIQEQQLKISEQQLQIQEQQSLMMTAKSEIDKLKKRASSVNETELQSKKQKEECEKKLKEAQAMKDEAARELQQARNLKYEASSDRDKAYYLKKEANEIQNENDKLKKEVQDIQEATERRLQMHRRANVVIWVVFIAMLTGTLVEHSAVLRECGQWFADRFESVKAICSGIAKAYTSIVAYIEALGASIAIGHIVAIVICLVAVVALVALFKWLIVPCVVKLYENISQEYYNVDTDIRFTVCIAVICVLSVLCLFAYNFIKAYVSLNIFSVWLLLSLISTLLLNIRQIIDGIKQ